jgi:hypothetical protein
VGNFELPTPAAAGAERERGGYFPADRAIFRDSAFFPAYRVFDPCEFGPDPRRLPSDGSGSFELRAEGYIHAKTTRGQPFF